MDSIQKTFTNAYDLKKLLDLAAIKWNLITESDIKVESPYFIAPDGFICEQDTHMLIPIQKIICKVKPNKQEIDSIILIHNSEKGTLLCQAYKGKKPLINYQYFICSDENEDEIKKYTAFLLNLDK